MFALTLFVLSFSACEKEEENSETPAPGKTALLTAKTWKQTGFILDPPVEVDGEIISDLFEACMADNTLKFNTNNTYQSDEGNDNCYPEDPRTESGQWQFNADESGLLIDGEEVGLKELKSDRLKLVIEMNLEEMTETALVSQDMSTQEIPSSLTIVAEYEAQ